MSPWPLIGGVGIAGVTNDDFVMPVYARPGDQIVLTKPLATQIAVNSY
jgi:hydrogenase maturation factor